MPGKLCNGEPAQKALIKNASAFCMGRKANNDGTLIGANPFSSTHQPQENADWAAGHAAVTAADPAGCCAE